MTQRQEDYSWVYAGIAILIGVVILYFLLFSPNSQNVSIKYREDKVDVSSSNFEPLGTSDSTVKGAWYDSANEYLVIKLSGTYYHYCGMPSGAWNGLKSSSSPYEYYQDDIKGNFDCRINPVPSYQ